MKSQSGIDPFAKFLFFLMLLVLPPLVYFILKPNPSVSESNLHQVKEFAEFIETRPELSQDPASQNPNLPPPTVAQAVNAPEATPLPSVAELTEEEQKFIQDVSDAWNREGFVQNDIWIDQVDAVFRIAERSHREETYDLLRRQIILARLSGNQAFRNRAQAWYEQYLKFESREHARTEIQEFFADKP